MTPRLARRLTSLYPRPWRARYADEFAALLETHSPTPSVIVNIIWCACREHAHRGFEATMTPARRLTLLMYACLAAMLAGVNLYWTIDDTSIIPAMRTHAPMAASWAVVAFGSGAALLVAAAAAAPIVRAMLLSAASRRRYDHIARLVIPFCAAAVLIGWMSIVIARTHWAPMPWDIAIGAGVPSNWPSLTARWILGSVTTILIAIGLVGSAVALRQAIEGAAPADSSYLRVTLGGLAAILVAMAIAALGWGVLAERYAPVAFRSTADGIYGSSIAVSWSFSLALFLVAAATAVAGVRGSGPRTA